MGMATGQAFVDVLDDLLDAGPGTPDSHLPIPVIRFNGGIATQPFTWRDRRLSPATAGQRGSVLRTTQAPSATSHATLAPALACTIPLEPAPVTQKHRHLTSAQRQALDTLVALGARLDDAFTARDLHSAFRTLARRYHPDRHPGLDAHGTARLAETFARVRDACDRLKAVAEVVH